MVGPQASSCERVTSTEGLGVDGVCPQDVSRGRGPSTGVLDYLPG